MNVVFEIKNYTDRNDTSSLYNVVMMRVERVKDKLGDATLYIVYDGSNKQYNMRMENVPDSINEKEIRSLFTGPLFS